MSMIVFSSTRIAQFVKKRRRGDENRDPVQEVSTNDDEEASEKGSRAALDPAIGSSRGVRRPVVQAEGDDDDTGETTAMV